MFQPKIRLSALADVKSLSLFLGLAGFASILPFYLHLQWLTGPIVNALLIIMLFLVGIRSALVLCLIPSLMALSGGLLPSVLAPVVPFVMIGNAILVLSVEAAYNFFRHPAAAYWLGVLIGAFFKFLFLYLSTRLIAKLLIKEELAVKVAEMMSWPQFATALAGGLIAWAALRWLKRI